MADLVVLGAGTPTPTAERFGSSHVLKLGDDLLMFDCGPAATHKLVKAGLFPTQINYLFFTHHHFDHDIDYPCFLLCRWDQSIGQEKELQVFGPPLTEKITEGIIGDAGLFSHDWKARVNHPLSQQVYVNRGGTLPRLPPKVSARDVGSGLVYSADDWVVTAAPADHVQPWLDSLAYRVDCDEGSFVFTGDTSPCDSVVKLAKDADVMLCMCWDDQEVMQQNGEFQGQCGTTGSAEMAQAAQVKKLVLVHIGPHLSQEEPMNKGLRDIEGIYDGKVIFSRELEHLVI